MIKYCFNVYDHVSGDKITQVITNVDNMLETLETLSKLGMVKGYILDDNKDCEVKNEI